MANIQPYLDNIKSAVYGEEVRGSIHDAIEAINNEVQEGDGGISEITEGTPTDIEGLLEGKDGKLQKMTLPPPIHTLHPNKAFSGGFHRVFKFTMPTDMEAFRGKITFIFDNTQGNPTPIEYLFGTNGLNSLPSIFSYTTNMAWTGLPALLVNSQTRIVEMFLSSGFETMPGLCYVSHFELSPSVEQFEFTDDSISQQDWGSYTNTPIMRLTASVQGMPVETATRFQNLKTIKLTGDVTGSVSTNFSGDVNIDTTLQSFPVKMSGDVTAITYNLRPGVLNNLETELDWSSIGEIPIENIPKGAVEKPVYVNTETDMLSLTINDVQNGDTVICKDHDPAHMYLVVDDSKLGTMDAFIQYKGGAASSVDWQNIHGKPAFAKVATSGLYNDLYGTPESLPANGGTADSLNVKQLSSGMDLDSIITTGIYGTWSDSVANSIINSPTTNTFTVMVWGKASQIFQQLTENTVKNYQSTRTWFRSFHISSGAVDSKSDWVELYTTKNLPTFPENLSDFKDDIGIVKSWNGIAPDESGDVKAEIGGRNLFHSAIRGYVSENDGTFRDPTENNNEMYSEYYIPVKPRERYIAQMWVTVPENAKSYSVWIAVAYYDSQKTFLNRPKIQSATPSGKTEFVHRTSAFTIPDGASYMRIMARFYNDGKLKIERGSVPTDWTPAPEDKQDKLSGISGQIIGFDENGNAVPIDLRTEILKILKEETKNE